MKRCKAIPLATQLPNWSSIDWWPPLDLTNGWPVFIPGYHKRALKPAEVEVAVREGGLLEPALGAHLGIIDTGVDPLALPPRSTPNAMYSTAPAPLAMAIFCTVVVKVFREYLIEPTIADIEGLLALSKSKRVSRYARILGLHALKMEELLICSKNGNIKTIVRSPHHS